MITITSEAQTPNVSNEITRSDIEKNMKEIINYSLGIPIEKILVNSHFNKDLGMDSLDVVELILYVEKKYEITIPDEQLEKVTTLNEMVEVIYNIKKIK